MTRRELLETLIVLPLIGGCASSSYNVVSGFEHAGIVTVNSSELIDASQKPYPVVIVHAKNFQYPIYLFNHENSGYTAVLGECTHKGCELELQGSILACPCHGSEFESTGKVLNGPASKNLQPLTVKYTESGLMISRF
jgi:cytochrome b6-f complex iron-sulfur subunit